MGRLKSLGFRVRAQGERLKTAEPGSWRTGKSSTERGYDYRWQQAREQYLRDHPLCVYCERKGLVTAANTVDHIVAHRGDQDLFWDKDNWQPLCGPCHSADKQKEEAAGF
ncbi:HNH endonuclease signature motif containing protein [Pseudomonas aeruginosa]|nr:HNH endonuclease signature motif containing protein [Pseudomonas aeruginosa]MDY1215405.1 HNH endonuclease signature motif containing protein [Pseudomonas aeruginosa]